jgi:hypothetical protein
MNAKRRRMARHEEIPDLTWGEFVKKMQRKGVTAKTRLSYAIVAVEPQRRATASPAR